MHQWVQGPDMYDSCKLCATKLVYRELVSIALSLALRFFLQFENWQVSAYLGGGC